MGRAVLRILLVTTVWAGLFATAAKAAAPTATTRPATGVTVSSATLEGRVAPNREATTYHFEYGPTTAYGSRTPDGAALNGGGNKSVSATVTGLTPGTLYHFRLVANNPSGVSTGADMTFTTLASGAAPVTIAATPATVTFGKPVTIAGQVAGGAAGTRVDLESTPFPFTSPFTNVATGSTTTGGAYSFTVTPTVVTRYHVEKRTQPRATSADITVRVRAKVTLRLSDRTPARGTRVRFRGSVLPAHDGKQVRLQRRTASGWKTIATPTLVAATPVNGVARSRYKTRRRVRRDSTYRTVFLPRDGDHVRGKSRKRRAFVQ